MVRCLGRTSTHLRKHEGMKRESAKCDMLTINGRVSNGAHCTINERSRVLRDFLFVHSSSDTKPEEHGVM